MISGYILLFIAILAIICHYAFVMPSKDKKLFKLYENRDNLTLYAMENPGTQHSDGYKHLLKIINSEIYLINNNISFVDFYKSVIEATVDDTKRTERMVRQIKSDSYMDKIFEETYDVFEKFFIKKFKLFYHIILKPFSFILKFIITISDCLSNDKIKNKINRMFTSAENVSSNCKKYMNLNGRTI